jgi:DNA mismatch repair protein MutS2
MEQNLMTLDYPVIQNQIKEFVASGLGRRLVENMRPLTRLDQVQVSQNETHEARSLLDAGAQIPLRGLFDITELIDRVSAGSILEAVDLMHVEDFLRGCSELKRYMQQKKGSVPLLAGYSEGIFKLSELEGVISGALDGSRIAASASTRLGRIREQLQRCEGEIEGKLNQMLNSPTVREYLQEPFVSIKNGHYVLPVKAACRANVAGVVVDSSGSGATVFIEPAAVRKLTDQKLMLRRQEEDEEYQIRAWLTAETAGYENELRQNLEWMGLFDFIIARARYSQQISGQSVELDPSASIYLKEARHPLLGADAVPLTLWMPANVRTLVITGPNTGGKTVALKTVGLLAAMAQSGLQIPAEAGSRLPVFTKIMADIGDEQSIQQSLSTFSAHMKNIAGIIARADKNSLILLDEIGTGTDPAEGTALASAILEELHKKGAVTLATTHYEGIKVLAENHPGFINGGMAFDPETLKPLYQLEMGKSGSSHAFWIAQRLGVGSAVIQRAKSWLEDPVKSVGTIVNAELKAEDTEEKQADDPVRTDKKDMQVGDMVIIRTTGEKARVLAADDPRGNLLLQVKDRRMRMHRKRVRPYLDRAVLYPDGYDMNEVLLSKEERKIDKIMARKITDRIRVIHKEEEE